MRPPAAPVVLDGSYGEGGPTLVRTALALSALTQQPVRIEGVRGGMPRPGLRAEDLAIARGLAKSTSAEMVGAQPGSASFSFLPTRLPRPLPERIEPPEDEEGPGTLTAPVVLTALLPVAARAGQMGSVSVVGETHGHNVLGYDAFAGTTVPALRRFGLYATTELIEAGFGRYGRGLIRAEVEPSALQGVVWDSRGKVLDFRAVVTCAEVGEDVGRRGVAHLQRLARSVGMPLEVEEARVRSRGPGASVTVWAEYERGFGSATALGARGVRIESVAQSAFEQFLQWFRSDATVDQHLADQLLVTAAIAETDVSFRVPVLTERLLTAVWVVKQFLPIYVTVRGAPGEPGTISIRH